MKDNRKVAQGIFAAFFVLIILAYPAANLIINGESLSEAIVENIAEDEDLVQTLETTLEEELLFRNELVELYGLLNIVQGKKEDNSFDTLKDKNNMLFNGNFWKGYGDDQKELAVRTRRLYDRLTAEGTQMGVVIYPMKVADKENRYYGLPYDDYSEIAEEYFRWIRYYGVPLLDLQNICEACGLTTQEAFFRTDHHWTPGAAFEGYTRIVEWMNEEFQADLDPDYVLRSLDSYEQITYENAMFGSEGRDVGMVFAGGMEDFTVIYPREEGSYTLTRGTLKEQKTYSGSFEEALLELENLPKASGMVYSAVAESVYLHNGVDRYVSIVNHEAPTDRNILLLRDSYSTPVGAFLAQSFAQVDMLWLLEVDEEELDAYLNENHYDYVVVALYNMNLSEQAFPFGMAEEE